MPLGAPGSSQIDRLADQTGIPKPAVLVLGRLDAVALGVSSGAVAGLWLFVATAALILRGGPHVGRTLSLLAQYFPGFDVTWAGAFVGLAYATAVGFLCGYAFAILRNSLVLAYFILLKRRAEQRELSDILDRMM